MTSNTGPIADSRIRADGPALTVEVRCVRSLTGSSS